MSQIEIYKASAGSGKTFNLAYQFIRLVLSNPDKYNSCLAVTFTNDATKEMKERIISELILLSKGQQSLYFNKLLLDLNINAEQLIHRSKIVIINILHDYSRFSVKTIDSFVQRILRAFIIDLGIFENYKIELNTDKVIKEVCLSVFKRVEKDKELRKWLIKFSLYKIKKGKYWNFKDDLYNLCAEMLKEKPQNLESSFHELKEDSEKIFLSYSKDYKLSFEKSTSTLAKKALDTIHMALGEKPNLGNKFKYIYSYLEKCINPKTAQDFEMKVTVRKSLQGFEFWHAKNASDEVKVSIASVYPVVLESLTGLSKLIEEGYMKYLTFEEISKNYFAFAIQDTLNKELRRYRERENVLLISDTNLLLNEIIGDQHTPFIFERAGSTYSHLLIDEFQDTSRLQWQNFKPLLFNSISEGNYNMIVGDVKQSVYRWRGGDWNLLLSEIAKDFSGYDFSEITLDDNFRSRREIVEFNNLLFKTLPKIIQWKFNLDIKDISDQIKEYLIDARYDEIFLKAYEGVEQNLPDKVGGEVSLDFLKIDSLISKRHKLDSVREKLLKSITDLFESGYKPNQICILVRTNSEAREIVEMLLSFPDHITALSKDALLLSNSHSVNFILNFLRYLSSRDPVYLMAINQNLSKLFPKKYKINYDLYLDERFDELEHILNLHIYLNNQETSVYELIESCIANYGLGDFEEEVIYLQHFQNAILEYSQLKSISIRDLLDWWKEEGDRFSVSLMNDLDAIQVSTIHKSKGLAYDIVILPFCDWGLDEKKPGSILWCKSDDEPFNIHPYLPMPNNKKLMSSIFYKEAYKESVYACMDSLNLMYVACTRAREKLYIWCVQPNENKIRKGDITRISDALYFLLYHINIINVEGLTDAKNSILEILQKSKPQDIVLNDKCSKTFSLRPIKKYSVFPWRDILKIKSRSGIYFATKGDENDKLSYGTMLHELLSKIRYKNDLDNVVTQFLSERSYWIDNQEFLIKKLKEYINFDKVSDWFNERWTVLNERTIVNENNQSFILDRLIYDQNRTIVIDFKFGNQDKKHIKQVSSYKKLLITMGYKNVEGYLYYPDEKLVKAV